MTPAARTRPLRLLGLAAMAGVLAGCAATSQAADPSPVGAVSTAAPATTPTSAGPSSTSAAAPSPSATLPPTWGTGPQAPADPNGAAPAVNWTPESRAAATTVAVKFMGAYARPKTPQPDWSNALAPYASLDLRGVLAGVDTTYITTGSPAPTGTLQAGAGDPYNAVVLVGTSDGPWQLTVHRQPDASWLVAAIQPPVKQGH